MKTTRFLNMMAASLVGVAFMSCSSQDDVLTPAGQTYTMSVTAQKGGDGTRALNLDGNTLNATWTEGDVVKVYNSASTELGELTAQTAGKSTILSGSLTKLPENDETLTLKYLSPSYSAQDGTLTGADNSIDKVCDYATATVTATVSGTNVTTGAASFQNQQAVVKFTLVDNAATPNAIKPTALTINDGTDDIVTLTDIPDATYSTNGEGVLYVAIPGFTGKTITLTATVGSDTYTCTTSEPQTLGNGKYYGVTAKMAKQASVPTGALSGQFSVNSSGDKVNFSKGNLRYASGTWSFFDNQYDYYTSYSADAWDNFGWSASTTPYGMDTSTSNSLYSGDFVDWGATMGTGWFTLSSAEWTYLFNTRTTATTNMPTGTNSSAARYTRATVAGVSGVILFPDNYAHPAGVTVTVSNAAYNTGNTAYTTFTVDDSNWVTMESAGCVFLPAAGYREGSSPRISLGTCGFYWSSTANGTDQAYNVFFSTKMNLNPAYTMPRYYGACVRLVRDVAASAPAVPTTLAELKTWVKAGNTETTYYGYYVNSSGEIHSSYVSGDIGRVAYYQNSDVETAASGRRILVLALVDVDRYRWKNASTSGESDYNSTTAMNGLAFCQSHSDNSTTYPAAYGAYNWDKSRPSGSTNWFLPSRAQWDKMLTVAKRSGTGQINGGYYWSATEVDQPRNAYFYVFSDSYWGYSLKDEKNDVRACFAY